MSLTSMVDREQAEIHFVNHARHSFQAIYIGEEILGVGEERVRAEVERCAHTRLRRLPSPAACCRATSRPTAPSTPRWTSKWPADGEHLPLVQLRPYSA
ncbi:hypothetical protein AB0L41_05465 [Amycolatopsis mediterranei]|uniref:hypothetical protein n=1 Tax=Amycolatopsis mediterranei TaxID=33910 RepID=UPI00343A2EDF